MKKIQILKKTSAILLGALGLSSLLASCNKEKDCDCTSTSTYAQNGGATYTYTDNYTVTTNEKCVELNREVTRTDTYSTYYGNITVNYTTKIECD